MSTNWLKVIPTDPSFVPSGGVAEALVVAVKTLTPNTQNVLVTTSDHPDFVDAGANFCSARCPRCKAEVSIDWWQQRMSSAYGCRFERLDVALPCCGAVDSLNEIIYDWPQGFARFRL